MHDLSAAETRVKVTRLTKFLVRTPPQWYRNAHSTCDRGSVRNEEGRDVRSGRIYFRALLLLALGVWSAQGRGAEEAAAPAPEPSPGELRREGEGRPPLTLGADFGLASPTPA